MNQKQTLKLLTKNAAIYQRFSSLSVRSQLAVCWEIFRRQVQIMFSKKFVWFLLGILGYFVLVYVINYRQSMIDRMTQEDILPWLVALPLTVLAVYLNMQLISSEKENRTLEVMFTTAGSRYKVWLFRLTTLNLLLLMISIGLSHLAFFTIADMAVWGTAAHGFVPAYFVGGMTLYFAVKFRSGFAAGMVSGGILILLSMFSEALYETRYFLYFNPYDVPRQLDPETWQLWMWQNRMALMVLGVLLQFFALRGLEERERLLR
ncbi:MAG: hypothetical protein ACE5HS_15930 [bacterium]